MVENGFPLQHSILLVVFLILLIVSVNTEMTKTVNWKKNDVPPSL